jgi:hypothetical protein
VITIIQSERTPREWRVLEPPGVELVLPQKDQAVAKLLKNSHGRFLRASEGDPDAIASAIGCALSSKYGSTNPAA